MKPLKDAYLINWNGNLNIVRDSYINGYTYGIDKGKVRLQNGSTLYTPRVSLQNEGRLSRKWLCKWRCLTNVFIGEKNYKNSITIGRDLNLYRSNEIVNANLNIDNTMTNHKNASLKITDNSNINVSNNIYNDGIFSIYDSSKVKTN